MREQLGQKKGIGPALETRQSHTIKYGVNQVIPERETERGIRVLRYCEVLQREAQKYTDVRSKHRV